MKASCAATSKLRNMPPPLASNDLFGGGPRLKNDVTSEASSLGRYSKSLIIVPPSQNHLSAHEARPMGGHKDFRAPSASLSTRNKEAITYLESQAATWRP